MVDFQDKGLAGPEEPEGSQEMVEWGATKFLCVKNR